MNARHLAEALASAVAILAIAGCSLPEHALPSAELKLVADQRSLTDMPPGGPPIGGTAAATTGTQPSAPADPAAVPGCDANYLPCVPTAVDVDCAQTGQDGPQFVSGPVRVIGIDVYHLDGVDHDGMACERLGR